MGMPIVTRWHGPSLEPPRYCEGTLPIFDSVTRSYCFYWVENPPFEHNILHSLFKGFEHPFIVTPWRSSGWFYSIKALNSYYFREI